MLTLENFTEIIDNEILKRGRDYFDSGNVIDLDANEDGWSAIVVGTYDYSVEIMRLPDGTFEADCDCPYEYGPYCKHIAAVFWALREKPPKANRQSSSRQSVQKIVERLTHEQLVEIVMGQIKADRALGNQILLKYSTDAPGKAVFVRTIEDIVRKYDDHGFLDYMGSTRAGREIQSLVTQAENLLKTLQPDRAFVILQAVLETVPKHLNSADDSSGDFSGSIEYAFEVLEDLIEQADKTLKQSIFEYCLEQYVEPQYKGWDFPSTFLWHAGEIVETPQQRDRIFTELDRFIESHQGNRWGNYNAEHALQIKQDVMTHMGASQQDIEQLLLANAHLDRPRKTLIQMYINEGRYSTARDLCIEGIKQSQANSWPGLVVDYEDLLLEIAKKDNDPDAVLKMAQKLMFNARDFDRYYDILRDYTPPADWPQAVQQIIAAVKSQTNHWQRNHLLSSIYERENMWRDLFDLARQDQQSGILHRYYQDFHKHFPAEMCVLYEQVIRRELTRSSSRGHYQEMAGLLQRIIDLGQPDQAGLLIDEFKETYPKRKAMIEELNKVRAQ